MLVLVLVTRDARQAARPLRNASAKTKLDATTQAGVLEELPSGSRHPGKSLQIASLQSRKIDPFEFCFRVLKALLVTKRRKTRCKKKRINKYK
jgi:hypothetical protein